MSGVNILYSLLTTNAAVLALVPQARIKAGVLSEGIALPAIALSKISSLDENFVSPGVTVRVTQRVQVDVLAANYTSAQAVLAAVRKACRDKHGTIAGFDSVAVLTDAEGPDQQYGELTGIYMQTQDFKVQFAQTP